MLKFSYTWTINKFSSRRHEMQETIKISTGPENKVKKWCLLARPQGFKEDSKVFLSLFLKLVSCSEREVWALVELSILNSKQKKIVSIKNHKPDRISEGASWGKQKFIRRDILFDKAKGHLPDDQVIIFCKVNIVEDPAMNSNIFKVPECRLSEDFGKLFDCSSLSDVTLCVRGKEFPAHKNILAARSPVFKAMFENQMKEKDDNRVEIEDIEEYEVITEMLRFAYTGKAPNLDRMADGLLTVADKYAFDRLKVMCEQVLFSNLNIESVCAICVLADLHSAHQLKTHAINFIKSNAKDVANTQGWHTMLQGYPHLVNEAFCALASQQSEINKPDGKLSGPSRKQNRNMSFSSSDSSDSEE